VDKTADKMLDKIVALFGEEREPGPRFEGLHQLITTGHRPLSSAHVDFEREETYGPEGIDIVAALRDIYDRLVRQAYREEGVRLSLAQVTGLTLAEVAERLLEYRRRTPRRVLDYYLRYGDWPPTRPSNCRARRGIRVAYAGVDTLFPEVRSALEGLGSEDEDDG
jgi:hypothetical protein